mgnify:CR=1 FL=1
MARRTTRPLLRGAFRHLGDCPVGSSLRLTNEIIRAISRPTMRPWQTNRRCKGRPTGPQTPSTMRPKPHRRESPQPRSRWQAIQRPSHVGLQTPTPHNANPPASPPRQHNPQNEPGNQGPRMRWQPDEDAGHQHAQTMSAGKHDRLGRANRQPATHGCTQRVEHVLYHIERHRRACRRSRRRPRSPARQGTQRAKLSLSP